MSDLRIRLFGDMEVVRDGQRLARFPTRKSRALLAFLTLHHRRFHPREMLANIFWPGSPTGSARKRLRTELWLTRKFLEPTSVGESVLTTRNDSVGLNPASGVWVDVAELERNLECENLQNAAELYRGDLLEGFYEDWCLEARERLRARYLSVLERLMSFHQARREWPLAIEYGRRVLDHEPLCEHVHRDLMRCHFEMGNRTAALRQYHRCADLLMAELDVEPMHETSILCQQIKTFQGQQVAG